MVKRFRTRLVAEQEAGSEKVPIAYGCAFCSTHFCLESDITSRYFHGKHGKALLVDRCENSYFGAQEQKELLTGTHIVRDVFCSFCDKCVGWCYDLAHNDKECYKVYRYVLERKLIRVIGPDIKNGSLAIVDRPVKVQIDVN